MSTPTLPQPAATGTSALLRISSLRLELPQSEICALEAATDVDPLDAPPYSVGWILHAEQRWPVYSLSPELSLLIVIPEERRTCAVLASGQGFLGILCDEAGTIQVSASQRQELPPPMRLADSPVLSLVALENGEVACATTAERIAAHLSRLKGL